MYNIYFFLTNQYELLTRHITYKVIDSFRHHNGNTSKSNNQCFAGFDQLLKQTTSNMSTVFTENIFYPQVVSSFFYWS